MDSALVVKDYSLSQCDSDDTKILFRKFREVFSAEKQVYRAVFWIEEKFGKFILRSVPDIKRKKKSEDIIVGKVLDVFSAKILIGNFFAGRNMTQIKWELYSDFNLSDKIEEGRFDYKDLLSGLELVDQDYYAQSSIYPKGDWDFDGIILTHQCPKCYRVFDKEFIILNPFKFCDSCGEKIPVGKGKEIISRMLKKINYFPSKIILTNFEEIKKRSDNRIQLYIDPMCNSVILWILTSPVSSRNPQIFEKFVIRESGYNYLDKAFKSSIFCLMSSNCLSRDMNQYLEEIDVDGSIMFIRLAKKYGNMLKNKDSDELLSNAEAEKLLKFFPHFINELIIKA